MWFFHFCKYFFKLRSLKNSSSIWGIILSNSSFERYFKSLATKQQVFTSIKEPRAMFINLANSFLLLMLPSAIFKTTESIARLIWLVKTKIFHSLEI
jgi:hypothetical protein